jgi:membrane fusion protein (multidrug efflux system)
VKIVQRVPVRITVEQRRGDPVLRSGMSAYVTIDTATPAAAHVARNGPAAPR